MGQGREAEATMQAATRKGVGEGLGILGNPCRSSIRVGELGGSAAGLITSGSQSKRIHRDAPGIGYKCRQVELKAIAWVAG